ncbi:helix-turn-helix transcriptional regulator [Bacillus licheniformis]|uniref:helix-turn-helix transcriptional regulator n=1 Tax=Bacillus licheniformis TaxID=1402 RepID=UPI002DC0572D|nr:helix-turn-helix transcriptional regulator [Bacillus licheniformis]MEC0490211.1 helix-turn-helix transcriptional regulator [Bacillus licheniformis]
MTSQELQKLLSKKRTELGYTHQEVADLLGSGITRQYYGMIEKGERRPSVNVAKKLGELLKVNWTIFFE